MLLFNYSRAAQVFAATPFDGNGGDDVACKVDVSISRAAPFFDTWVYISGTSLQSTTNWNDVVTRAYRIDRTFVWSQEVPGAFDDRAVDMVAVPGGDLYVLTGRFNGANFDYRTVSYDISDPDGAPYWTNPPVYDPPNGGIEAPASIKYVITNDILLPDIHVSGRSQGLFDTNIKYATVKYVQ